MKFYNDFNSMFNAQSGLKSDMSVFNEFSDLGSSFERYEKLFDCAFIPSPNRENCYTYIIKPKKDVLKRVDEYARAYNGIDDMVETATDLLGFGVRLAFFAEIDSKKPYVKVLYTKDNKTKSDVLDIGEVKDKEGLFKTMREQVLKSSFAKDIHDCLDVWENAYNNLIKYSLSDED